RYNWCTARQLTEVLAWIARKPSGRLFFDSLSIAGVDGSLKKRLKDIPGKVRGKTGTMRSIRTLSGYADRNGGGRYAF
ncbi:MAG: D-alanyl-D-alanine carboxypeptidase, partial [Phycisphaerales bacterium]